MTKSTALAFLFVFNTAFQVRTFILYKKLINLFLIMIMKKTLKTENIH